MTAPRVKHKRDSAATRARIEKEALRLFAEKGVDGATIRDLSIAVGVADAALYRYYESKEQIASDIFTRHYGALAREIHAIAGKNLPLRETVVDLVGLFCRLFDEKPDVFAFILLNQHAHLRFVREGENVVDELGAIMARARDAGEITLVDQDLAAAMALGAVLQPATFKLYGRLPGAMRNFESELVRGALAAVGAT